MCRAALRSCREDESLLAPHLSLGYPPTTAFTSAYVREPCNGVVQSWSPVRFWEWRLGRPGDRVAGRLEARPLTRAIPSRLGLVPAHRASHVRANGGSHRDRSSLVTICRNLRAISFDDLSLAASASMEGLIIRVIRPDQRVVYRVRKSGTRSAAKCWTRASVEPPLSGIAAVVLSLSARFPCAAHALVLTPATIAVGGTQPARPSRRLPGTRFASSETTRTRTEPRSGSR